MLGAMYLAIAYLDFKGANECYWWIRIHLSYKAQLVGFSKLSTKQQIKNFFIEGVGIVVTLAIIYLLIKIVTFI